jgi:hypothetical protein
MQGPLNIHLQNRGIFIAAENMDKINEENPELFAKLRHVGFGASDSSKLLNVNPFPRGTREELLEDKINEFHDPEIGFKASVRAGRELEPLILEKAEELLDDPILKPSHMYGRSNGLLTNFDGVIYENGTFVPAEAKFVSFFGKKYYNFKKGFTEPEEKEDALMNNILGFDPGNFESIQEYILEQAKLVGIPPYYYTQLQQQIDFLGSNHGYLVVLNYHDWTLYGFKVARDQPMIDELNHTAQGQYIKLCIAKGWEIPGDDDEDDI